MAVLFAATYPERVSGLILHATAARLIPADETIEQRNARRDFLEQWVRGWGTEASTTLDIFAPAVAADATYRAWEPRFERQSASPAGMRDLIEMWEGIDVREVLPTLTVPTLVLSRRDDPMVRSTTARETAAAIPALDSSSSTDQTTGSTSATSSSGSMRSSRSSPASNRPVAPRPARRFERRAPRSARSAGSVVRSRRRRCPVVGVGVPPGPQSCASVSRRPAVNPSLAMSCSNCSGPTTPTRPSSAPDCPCNSPSCDGSWRRRHR